PWLMVAPPRGSQQRLRGRALQRMQRRIDAVLARVLTGWVDFVRARAQAVIRVITVLTVGLGIYASLALGINSDNVSLVPTDLPSRQAHEAFIAKFPNLEEAIFVVVDAQTPELAREASNALAERLLEEREVITRAYIPGGSSFFERKGLLYRSVDELDDFADQMARIQPLLTQLEQDPSIGNLARIVREGLDNIEDETSNEDWPLVLDRLSEATVEAWEEHPVAISWEELLLRDSSLDISTRRVIVAHPILDYGDILTGRRPIAAIRAAAAELGLSPERGVQVRITGNPALNYDEMIGIAWDVGVAGIFCFLLVALVLYRALRSMKIVVATLLTLLVGLIWTAAFTAAAIGTLNPLSITFAILFIGLGADFGIHLGTGYADRRRSGDDHDQALSSAAGEVGTALVFCTGTTAIGFYVFVPTDYLGVSELGLIAGTGMFVILFLTLTLLPALLSHGFEVDPATELRAPVRFRTPFWRRIAQHPKAIRRTAAVLGAGALALLPGLRFDANVIEMRDPKTESVVAFKDLLENSVTSPWYLNVLVPDLGEAQRLATELEALDEVDQVITLASFVPSDQEEKIEVLEDVTFLFEQPLMPTYDQTPPSAADQVRALQELHDHLANTIEVGGDAPLNRSMVRLREHLGDFLDRAQQPGQMAGALADLETVLLGPFPDHLDRLRAALETEAVSLDDIPVGLRQRMLAEDGTARLQVYPTSALGDGDAMRRFVAAIQDSAPNAAGVPLNLVEFGDVISNSFSQALVSALIIITLLLFALWRRVSDVLIVLIPLCLGAALTAATAVILDIRFDFTNVVVIPLVFGIGVDSAIHLVQRSRESGEPAEGLLASSTARAVFYSAVTTGVSFGSLALANHNGLNGLGLMLSFGLFYTVISVLILLPALLEFRSTPG
ncbi:MAG: MMPL family transporter, partial [Myxococcota bacterium]|nr:MMPL family transporter [Myxococcota bacterium]